MSSIIGIDEVGRGSLAGPVLVAALSLPRRINLKRKGLPPLRDSKKLSPNQRNIWFDFLSENPKIFFRTARVLSRSIDKINVANAANRAASRAFKKLVAIQKFNVKHSKVRLDGGLFLENMPFVKARSIVKGDEKVNAIKLASIVAKVTRDKYMNRAHKKYPKYFFNEHKGYGTKKHILAIKKNGPSELHRLSFLTKF